MHQINLSEKFSIERRIQSANQMIFKILFNVVEYAKIKRKKNLKIIDSSE